VRILHFVDGFEAGGKERQLIELLKYTRAGNYAATELVLMSPEIGYPEVLKLGVKIHYLLRSRKKDPLIFPRLYRLCLDMRPDIIHTWDSMTSFYAIPVARLLGLGLVNGMIRDAPQHLAPLSRLWTRSKLTFPFSDVVVANSRAGLLAYNAPPAKSICISNGFDWNRLLNLADPAGVRNTFGITTPRVVGMVASFSDLKDYDTFVIAAQMVLEHRSDVTFIAVGDGKHLERCKSLVAPPHRERVRFLGWQEGIHSIINMMEIGALATYTEGISNSILEYMAMGKPVVATEGGGTREIVTDGETGFLVPRGDAGEFARRVDELLCDPAKGAELGARGRARVQSLFSIEAMGNQFMRVYERVAKIRERANGARA